MSPGLRLLVAIGALLGAALAGYLLPTRAGALARVLAVATVATVVGLLISVVPVVNTGGAVERSLGELVPGVKLAVRGDLAGVILALAAAVAAMLALLESGRTPLERSALLLCLAGTCTVCLAAGTVFVFAGLEMGNVGALLLAAAGGVPRRRALLAFAVQHGGALGLLAASVELQNAVGTSDLTAIPASALSIGVALPWALAGVVRLGAAAGLPGAPGSSGSPAWLAVAAVPSGFAVLLRLTAVAGGGGLAKPVATCVVIAGLLLAAGGAASALGPRTAAPAAGRGLCVALAGQVVTLVGIGTTATQTAAAAVTLALLVAAASSPAWGAGGDPGGGPLAAPLRALALAGAAGLPGGAATAALLTGADGSAAPGLPGSMLAVPLAGCALAAALAGAGAARAALDDHSAAGGPGRPRADASAAVAIAAVLGLLPGALVGGLAGRITGAGAVTTIDAAAIRGPGGGWAGGYLLIALVVLVVGVGAAAALQGLPRPVRAPSAIAPTDQPPAPDDAVPPAARRRLLEAVVPLTGRCTEALRAADGWLVTQPNLLLLVLGAGACLLAFR